MTQWEIDHAVAAATGESVAEVRRQDSASGSHPHSSRIPNYAIRSRSIGRRANRVLGRCSRSLDRILAPRYSQAE